MSDKGKLLDAVKRSDLAAVEVMLANGADVNVADSDGWTPLHWAVRRGGPNAVAMVKALIAKGAAIDATTKSGVTPARWAEVFGKTELMEVLRAASRNDEADSP